MRLSSCTAKRGGCGGGCGGGGGCLLHCYPPCVYTCIRVVHLEYPEQGLDKPSPGKDCPPSTGHHRIHASLRSAVPHDLCALHCCRTHHAGRFYSARPLQRHCTVVLNTAFRHRSDQPWTGFVYPIIPDSTVPHTPTTLGAVRRVFRANDNRRIQ